jgi:DNA repair exonuclease SbcCD ATPase subunit
MRSQFTRRIMLALVVLLTIGLCFDEASAQRKRTKRSRRITNPVTSSTTATTPPPVVPATQTDPQIISTADQQATEPNNTSDINGQLPTDKRRTNRKRAADPAEDEDSMRRTVNDLSNQVTKLSDKLTQMEQQQRTLVDLERLSRAEQRAEVLRTQLRDVQEKEGNLTARMEQIEFDLRPESIDRSVATYGSTHPEEARDARRRALESEKTRTRAQLDLLATSRQRLDTAIVNADIEVDKLRKRIEDATEPQPKTDTTDNTGNTEDTSTTTSTQPPIVIEQPAPKSTNPPR